MPPLFIDKKLENPPYKTILRQEEIEAIVYPSVRILEDAKSKGIVLTDKEMDDLFMQDEFHFYDLCEAKLAKEGKFVGFAAKQPSTSNCNVVPSLHIKSPSSICKNNTFSVGVQVVPEIALTASQGTQTSPEVISIVSQSTQQVPSNFLSDKATSVTGLSISSPHLSSDKLGCKFPCRIS